MQAMWTTESGRGARAAARRRFARALAVGIGAMTLAPVALAGTATVRWTHPDPVSIDGFRVHQSIGGAAFDAGVDVFKPSPDGAGVYVATVSIPDGVPVDLKLSAYSGTTGLSSVLSANSNSLFLLGAPGKPMVVIP